MPFWPAVIALYLNEVGRFLGKLKKASHTASIDSNRRKFSYDSTTSRRDGDVSEPLLGSSPTSRSGITTTDFNEELVPLKHLLNLKILIPVASYVHLAFLVAASDTIRPLSLPCQ